MTRIKIDQRAVPRSTISRADNPPRRDRIVSCLPFRRVLPFLDPPAQNPLAKFRVPVIFHRVTFSRAGVPRYQIISHSLSPRAFSQPDCLIMPRNAALPLYLPCHFHLRQPLCVSSSVLITNRRCLPLLASYRIQFYSPPSTITVALFHRDLNPSLSVRLSLLVHQDPGPFRPGSTAG